MGATILEASEKCYAEATKDDGYSWEPVCELDNGQHVKPFDTGLQAANLPRVGFRFAGCWVAGTFGQTTRRVLAVTAMT